MKIRILLMGAFLVWSGSIWAQKKITMGISADAGLFIPDQLAWYQKDGGEVTKTYMLKNGEGLSTGFYFEHESRPWMKQVIELKMTKLNTEVKASNPAPAGFSGSNVYREGEVYQISYTHLNVSYGSKFYLTKTFFAYPSLGATYSFKSTSHDNKLSFSLSGSLGADLKKINLLFSYRYGTGEEKGKITDQGIPVSLPYRNHLLQMTVQVPLKSWKNPEIER